MAEDQRDGTGADAWPAHEVNPRARHINQVVLVRIHGSLGGSPVVLLGPVLREPWSRALGTPYRPSSFPASSGQIVARSRDRNPREPGPRRRSAPATVHSRLCSLPAPFIRSFVLLVGELDDLVEHAHDAQRPRAVSRREPVNETAQPLRTIGMASGHNRLTIRGERQHRGPPVRRIGPAFDKSVAFQLRYRRRERRLLDLLRSDQVTQPTRPALDRVCSTDNAEKVNGPDAGSRMNNELRSSMDRVSRSTARTASMPTLYRSSI